MGSITTFTNVGANNLSDLSDVDVTVAASGGFLIYDGAIWVATTGNLSHSFLDNLGDDDHGQYVHTDPTGSARNIITSTEINTTLLDLISPTLGPTNVDLFRVRDGSDIIFSVMWEFETHNEFRILSNVQHLFNDEAGNITKPIISFVNNHEVGVHLTDASGHRMSLISNGIEALAVKSTGDICESYATNILSVGCTGFGAQLRIYRGGEYDNYVGFRTPTSLSSDLLWRLPNADGSSGTFLTTDGNLSTAFTTPDHGTLLGLSDDDHSQYVYTTPQGSSRNTILPTGNNISALTLTTSSHVTGVYPVLLVQNTEPSGLFGVYDVTGVYFTRSYVPVEIRDRQSLRLYNTTGYISVNAPSNLSAIYDLNLPTSVGTSGNYLRTDGAGNTTWSTIPTPISNEEIDDRVAALLQNNTGITWTYDDPNNTLTPTINLGAFNTDNLPEGSTNVYFTEERVDDRVAALVQDTASLAWTYSDATNELSANVQMSAFDTDDLSEGSVNRYYTSGRFDAAFATKTTDNLTEGSTNLYFANELVDDRVNTLLVGVSGVFKSYDDTGNTLYVGVNPTGLPDLTGYVRTYVNSSSRNSILSSGSVLLLDMLASGLLTTQNMLRMQHRASGYTNTVTVLECRPDKTVLFNDLLFSTSGINLPSPTYPYIRGYQTSTLNFGAGVGDGGYLLFGGSGIGGLGGIIDVHGAAAPSGGGNLITSLGGGSINTNSGFIQLGVSGFRSTLIKSTGTTNLSIYLPSNSGTLALLSDIVGGGGATGLNDLVDVILTTPSSGQALLFNSDEWVNANIPTPSVALDDLTDVSITSPATGHIISYSAGSWNNMPMAGTGFPASPYDGQPFYRTDLQHSFRYDGTRSKWLGELEVWTFAFNGNATSGEILRNQSVVNTNTRGFVAAYPITIVGSAGQTVNTGTFNMTLREGTSSVYTLLNFNNASLSIDTSLDYDFDYTKSIGVQIGVAEGSPGVSCCTLYIRRLGI